MVSPELRDSPVQRQRQVCEVYSRVVGYLRPTVQWNAAKRQEFKDRVTFRISGDGDAGSAA